MCHWQNVLPPSQMGFIVRPASANAQDSRTLGSSLASGCPLDTVPTAVFTSLTISSAETVYLPHTHCIPDLCTVFSSAGVGLKLRSASM